ncbi:MAG: succinate dehydrogenase iron-sulfur subunit, partial [Nitrospirae bacterium]
MKKRKCVYKIWRCNPEEDRRAHFEEFNIEIEENFRVLDGLIKIKDELDSTLTFRRSCAHGICGSCAMKINGLNRLACQTLIKNMPEVITIEPLPAFSVIKDLVVDMEPFFQKNEEVMPYLINNEPPPEKEWLQSIEEHKKIIESISCILCASCTSSCPSYWADKDYLGPAALLKSYRFIFDSRDRAKDRRIDIINNKHGLWRCHNIFNCTEVCPKEIKVTKHISELKRLI